MHTVPLEMNSLLLSNAAWHVKFQTMAGRQASTLMKPILVFLDRSLCHAPQRRLTAHTPAKRAKSVMCRSAQLPYIRSRQRRWVQRFKSCRIHQRHNSMDYSRSTSLDRRPDHPWNLKLMTSRHEQRKYPLSILIGLSRANQMQTIPTAATIVAGMRARSLPGRWSWCELRVWWLVQTICQPQR